MDKEAGLVSLWDLPDNKVYVVLTDKAKQRLFDTILTYADSWNNLARTLNLPINKYNTCKVLESCRYKKISLGMLKLLLGYVKSYGADIRCEIEKSIMTLAPKRGSSRPKANCLFYPKLPFNFLSESGAIVISALLHDGGIDRRLHPHYSNPLDVDSRKRVCLAFKNVFGEFNFLRSNPNINEQLYFPEIIGVILVYGLGMQSGRKVTNNPGIPNFIFNAPENVRAAFLKQAFDDEAHVHHTYRVISLKLASCSKGPARLLTDLQKLLQSFGIKARGPSFCETYEDNKGVSATKWQITISNQENLVKFLDKVGFSTPYKNLRLKEIVSSLKQKHYLIEDKPKILLRACERVQSNLGYITSIDLATVLDRSQVLAKVEIRKLRKQGVLTLVKEKRGSGAAHYCLVEK